MDTKERPVIAKCQRYKVRTKAFRNENQIDKRSMDPSLRLCLQSVDNSGKQRHRDLDCHQYPQLLTTELERYKGLAFHQLIDYEP